MYVSRVCAASVSARAIAISGHEVRAEALVEAERAPRRLARILHDRAADRRRCRVARRGPTRTRARRSRAIRSISARHAGSAIESSTIRRSPPARRHAASASRSITSHRPCTIASTSTLPDASPFDEMSNIGGARNVVSSVTACSGTSIGSSRDEVAALDPAPARVEIEPPARPRQRADVDTRALARARDTSRAPPAARGARRVQVSRLSISALTRAASGGDALALLRRQRAPHRPDRREHRDAERVEPGQVGDPRDPGAPRRRREPPPGRLERRRAVRAVTQPASARRAPGRRTEAASGREHTCYDRARAPLSLASSRSSSLASPPACKTGGTYVPERRAAAATSIAARPTAGCSTSSRTSPRATTGRSASATRSMWAAYATERPTRRARHGQPRPRRRPARCGS